MRVKFLKSLAGKDFRYGKGQEAEVLTSLAESFIRGELAVEIQVENTKAIPKIQREANKPDIQTKDKPSKRADKSKRGKRTSRGSK